jgi:protein-export membrane protein SecD
MWNDKVKTAFNNKIDISEEGPKSIRNHITEFDFTILNTYTNSNESHSLITISDFESFKKEIKKVRRSDPWFEQLDFLYLDVNANAISPYITQIPEINLSTLQDNKFICFIEKKAKITGDMIDKAYVSSNEKITTGYRVSIEMNDIGAEKWKTFTGSNIGKLAPIIMDNQIISMPSIRSEIPDGNCYIDGFSSIKEANYLATQLKFGKFNLALKKVYDKTVDASLGNQMITLGMFAFIIGISLVIVFMILYYKTAGLIASVSLILNILFMSSILSMLGATLTLPGIAGFILTVGIAVDANVIIFERIKEEARNGLPPLSAIESGYDRAFISIVDANVTTLLTAIILYFFGSGPIKGFAITLSAGIICSMFTAIYITRTIFNTLYYSKVPKKLSI